MSMDYTKNTQCLQIVSMLILIQSVKPPRVDKGLQPLMFNPALTTRASERMKTQRFSYFADFAARRPAAAGQFWPVSRGGTSCFLREAKPVKLKKVAFSHFFDTLKAPGFPGALRFWHV